MTNLAFHRHLLIRRILLTLAVLKRLDELLFESHSGHKSASFAYDPVGNRLTGPDAKMSYTYDAGNELTLSLRANEESAAIEYQYDKNGNLVKKTETDDDGKTKTWTYSYDFENRLMKVVKTDGCSPITDNCSPITVSFKYDPFGRRIEKKITEIPAPLAGASSTTSSPLTGEDGGGGEAKTYTYVYDNEDVIIEYLTKTEDGKTKTEPTRYTHGPGIDEPLAIIKSPPLQGGDRGEVVYYYHVDGLGSVVALTDAKQKVVE